MPSDDDRNKKNDERSVDGRKLLRELAARWRAADTLRYRARAVVNHAGEFRVTVNTFARLRRPNLARLTFTGDRPEANRVRVSDGRRIYDRPRTGARTVVSAYEGRLTGDIAHPLDEAAYSIDQFFSPTPFLPLVAWGGEGPLRIDAVRRTRAVEDRASAPRDVFRIKIARGESHDTLTLDALSLAPLRLVRWGVHAGLAQELLDETYLEVLLGAPLSPYLFAWTEADERGAAR